MNRILNLLLGRNPNPLWRCSYCHATYVTRRGSCAKCGHWRLQAV